MRSAAEDALWAGFDRTMKEFDQTMQQADRVIEEKTAGRKLEQVPPGELVITLTWRKRWFLLLAICFKREVRIRVNNLPGK